MRVAVYFCVLVSVYMARGQGIYEEFLQVKHKFLQSFDLEFDRAIEEQEGDGWFFLDDAEESFSMDTMDTMDDVEESFAQDNYGPLEDPDRLEGSADDEDLHAERVSTPPSLPERRGCAGIFKAALRHCTLVSLDVKFLVLQMERLNGVQAGPENATLGDAYFNYLFRWCMTNDWWPAKCSLAYYRGFADKVLASVGVATDDVENGICVSGDQSSLERCFRVELLPSRLEEWIKGGLESAGEPEQGLCQGLDCLQRCFEESAAECPLGVSRAHVTRMFEDTRRHVKCLVQDTSGCDANPPSLTALVLGLAALLAAKL